MKPFTGGIYASTKALGGAYVSDGFFMRIDEQASIKAGSVIFITTSITGHEALITFTS